MVSKNSKQVELEQKAYEFEMLRQQLANIDGELQQVHNRLADFQRVKESLNGISKSKKGEELLIPLGEGLFIKARIDNTEEVLIGVGNAVVVGKKTMKAVEYVQERIDEADKLIERLNQNAEYFVTKMRELEPEMRRLTNESRK